MLSHLEDAKRRFHCVYIDPPYGSTNNRDLSYNDIFLGGEWGDLLVDSLSRAVRLLHPKRGVILISINEASKSVVEEIMDRVWPGRKVGALVWRKRSPFNVTAHGLSLDHEYVLVYAAEGFRFRGRLMKRGATQRQDLTKDRSYLDRPNSFFPIHDPSTDVWYPPNPQRVWNAVSREFSKKVAPRAKHVIEDMIAEGKVRFPTEVNVHLYENIDQLLAAIDDGSAPINLQRLQASGLPVDFYVGKKISSGSPWLERERRPGGASVSSLVIPIRGVEDIDWGGGFQSGPTSEGTRVLRQLLGKQSFSYPKPLSLLTSLVWQSTQSGDAVLDFFAGSGTTAHAVHLCNEYDQGERKWVLGDIDIRVAISRLQAVPGMSRFEVIPLDEAA